MTQVTPILVYSADAAKSQAICQALSLVGLPWQAVTSWVRLESRLRQTSRGLAVIDARKHAEILQALSALMPLLESPPQVLLCTDSSHQVKDVAHLLEHRMTHFFGCSATGEIDTLSLTNTLLRMANRQPLGARQLLAASALVSEIQIPSVAHKSKHLSELESWLTQQGLLGFVLEQALTVLEELLSNAFRHGKGNETGVGLLLGLDATKLGMTVRDQSGALTPTVLSQVLLRSLRAPVYGHQPEKEGAGLGLYQIFRRSHHLVFAIRSSVQTEITAVLYRDPSHRDFDRRPKSFNLFWQV